MIYDDKSFLGPITKSKKLKAFCKTIFCTSPFYWHIHHKVLLEPPLIDTIINRIDYIKHNKPIEEVPTRLKLLGQVKGRLPFKLLYWGFIVLDKGFGSFVIQDIAKKYQSQINKLHKKECPGCPWDGKTIFPTPKRLYS